MKKGALLIAATGMWLGHAAAQTNVSLYGLMDAGITYTNNQGGGSNIQALSGQNPGNRLGFRGNEDLGTGLSAIFLLEAGFDLKNGAMTVGNRLFGRQLYAGLASTSYGTVTMGRQYDLLVNYLGPIGAPAMFGTNGNHPMDNDNLGNSFRINNSIKYASPKFNGWSFGGIYGFGEAAGDSSANRAWSVGTGYQNAGLSLGLGYIRLDRPASNTTGAVGGSGGVTTSDYPSLANTFVPGAIVRESITGIGAQYVFPSGGKIAALYTVADNDLATANVKFRNFEVNGKYVLTPTVWLGAAFANTKGEISSTGAEPKYNQVSVMANYNLSKRTDLYIMGIHQKASGSASNARIYAMPASSTDTQTVARIGMRHTF